VLIDFNTVLRFRQNWLTCVRAPDEPTSTNATVVLVFVAVLALSRV